MVKLHGFRPMLARLVLAAAILLALPCSSSAQDGGYVGVTRCAECHKDIYAAFAKTLHAKSGYWVQGFKDCESCHGPGAEHSSKGDPSKIQNPAKMDRQMLVELCLGCHQRKGKLAHWDSSTHSSRNLVCIDCHSVHSGYDKILKAEKERDVCFKCHGDKKADILKSSHHPIREGKMTCTDCHNPHGSVAPRQIDANSINEKCYECHAEKRGPFLYEHRPVTEDCTICHDPHGSNHDKLVVRKLPYLCQECHSASRHPGTTYAIDPATAGPNTFRSLSNRGVYRMCLNCHNNIHGSNHPSGHVFSR